MSEARLAGLPRVRGVRLRSQEITRLERGGLDRAASALVAWLAPDRTGVCAGFFCFALIIATVLATRPCVRQVRALESCG